MKRIAAMIISAVLCLSLVSCSGEGGEDLSSEPFSVKYENHSLSGTLGFIAEGNWYHLGISKTSGNVAGNEIGFVHATKTDDIHNEGSVFIGPVEMYITDSFEGDTIQEKIRSFVRSYAQGDELVAEGETTVAGINILRRAGIEGDDRYSRARYCGVGEFREGILVIFYDVNVSGQNAKEDAKTYIKIFEDWLGTLNLDAANVSDASGDLPLSNGMTLSGFPVKLTDDMSLYMDSIDGQTSVESFNDEDELFKTKVSVSGDKDSQFMYFEGFLAEWKHRELNEKGPDDLKGNFKWSVYRCEDQPGMAIATAKRNGKYLCVSIESHSIGAGDQAAVDEWLTKMDVK
ncbi:MAG: hypothetical protein K5629_01970 [Eubacteriales bacterium]|nr:hypothetical protein [Eubacteriales bacterium]